MENPFMARAIDLAIQNVHTGKGGPFGAVIVRGNEILAEASNSVTASNDPTAHAEVNAIRLACQHAGAFELRGCDIYTSCEPCPMCLGAIYWTRLEHIYYASSADDAAASGFDDEFIYRELSKEPGERRIPMVQVMRQKALAAFEAWRAFEGRVEY
jgi:guanine deaminase